LAGADLANILNLAALAATSAGATTIKAAALDAARDKTLIGLARPSAHVSERERRVSAVHESGHVLVARHTGAAKRMEKVTIVPHGAAGGLTMLEAEDDGMLDQQQLLARLDVLLGGRAAEIVEYGPDRVTTGAEDDLCKARSLALRMSTRWGFGTTLGPGGCERPIDQLSARTREMLDDEVAARLRAAQARALAVLRTHREDLAALSDALLERDTLTATQVDELLALQAPRTWQSRLVAALGTNGGALAHKA